MLLRTLDRFLTVLTRVFPQGYVLANNASIPYWATINRMRPCMSHASIPNIAPSDELAVRVV